jgi:membrane-bound ClpP family serine protease
MAWYNPLDWFKAGNRAADTAADLIGDISSGIDLLKLTDEERIQYTQGGFKLHLKYMEQNIDQNSERSKARREIAKAIVYYYLSLLTFVALVYRFDPEWAKFILEMSVKMKLGIAFIAIIVFYFGYYGIQGAIEKVKGK